MAEFFEIPSVICYELAIFAAIFLIIKRTEMIFRDTIWAYNRNFIKMYTVAAVLFCILSFLVYMLANSSVITSILVGVLQVMMSLYGIVLIAVLCYALISRLFLVSKNILDNEVNTMRMNNNNGEGDGSHTPPPVSSMAVDRRVSSDDDDDDDDDNSKKDEIKSVYLYILLHTCD